ncbi:MAG TPA: hypothetical protein PLZ03_06905 [Anaerolineales bacterium]|nr:hypothetical protein [Anaerolineales bacterium]
MKLPYRSAIYKQTAFLAMIFAAILFTSWTSTTAAAQTQGEITIKAQSGLDNFCKNGTWLPVKVMVENNGKDVDARVQASYKNDMNGNAVYGVDISLPATSRKEFFIYVFLDGTARNFNVSVLDGNKTLAKTALNIACINDQTLLFGLVTDDPSVFAGLNTISLSGVNAQSAQLKVEDLPDQAQGWEIMDALVISNVDTGKFSAEQKQAMEMWLARGGRLFVTGGTNWQPTAAGLENILPIKLTSTKEVTNLSAISKYSKFPLLTEEQSAVLATGQLLEGATTLVDQSGIPVLVEKQVGFGKVYFFAADPGLEPLNNWVGMLAIYEHLLGFRSPKPVWANGYWDAYQINDALSSMPELALPSFVYICCWLGLYVFVVGPLNYFVLRRIKRPELAWVSIPILVILFTMLAYFSGYAYRGTRPVLNRLMMAQGWEGVSQSQVNAVIGVYSPSRTTYTVETQEQFMLRPTPITSGNLQGNDDWTSIKTQDGTSMPDIRVEIGGMQVVGATGYLPALTVQSDLTITLGSHVPELSGTITNTGDYTIKDAVLVTASQWSPLGDIAPGQTKKVSQILVNNSNTSVTSQYTIMTTLNIDTYDYYSDVNPEKKRQAAFFQANTNTSNGSIHVNSGIYLMGWVNDEIATPTGLQSQPQEEIDTMLFFERLTPSIKTEAGSLMLTSSIFSWDSSLGDTITTPYYNMSNNGYTLRYQPNQTIRFSKVNTFELNIESTTTPDKVIVSLWNFETQTWDLIPMTFYTIDIPNPQQYIGMDGEVRLNLKGDPNDYVEITAINFTMTVQP